MRKNLKKHTWIAVEGVKREKLKAQRKNILEQVRKKISHGYSQDVVGLCVGEFWGFFDEWACCYSIE